MIESFPIKFQSSNGSYFYNRSVLMVAVVVVVVVDVIVIDVVVVVDVVVAATTATVSNIFNTNKNKSKAIK